MFSYNYCRKFSTISATALIVMLLFHAATAQQQPDPSIVRPELCAAPGSATIDGKIDESWQAAPQAKTRLLVEPLLKIDPQAASHAAFRCLWDEQHLYVLVEVTDRALSASNGAPWEQDSVEFLIDENGDRSDVYRDGDGQFRVNYRGAKSFGDSTPQKLEAVVVKTDSGYRVEAAIPFSTIKPNPGTKLGFDLQVNNDGGEGNRVSVAKWSDPTDYSWRDTSRFGTLRLVSRENIKPYVAPPAIDTAESKASDSPLGPAIDPEQRVPNWAADAIFYQIFPERFRNGDPGNDPTRESLEFPDMIPQNWAVTPWTRQWYARSDWERQMGPDFYEHGVFHRRFGGDLQGVIDKLDYLQTLGINTIYFNPVFYARSLHKYDGNSFHHIDPHFGPDPEGDFQIIRAETADPKTWQWTAADRLFLDLIQQSHQRNIRIVIDGVFNHTGRDFFAFADIVARQQQSDYLDWYIIKTFDDPATAVNEFKYECWWDVDTLPVFADNDDGSDLHPKPKQYIFESTRRWMDPNGDGDPGDGIDGWRLDVANEVPDKFWRDWNAYVRKLNPEAMTVAEVWTEAGDYLARCGFSSTMNYHGFAYGVKGFLVDGRLKPSAFADQLKERMQEHPRRVQFALQNLVDSHDTDRLASSIVNARTYPTRDYRQPDRFDYDVGERVSPRQTADYRVTPPNATDRKIQQLVALFQFTFVGAPMIYYGTEAGMDGADDPDDRMPMVWPDLEYETRDLGPKGPLDRQYPLSFNQELFDFYQSLVNLRQKQTSLRRGTFEVLLVDDSRQVLVYAREHSEGTALVALNRGTAAVELDVDLRPLKTARRGGNWKAELGTDSVPPDLQANGQRVSIQLAPWTGAVWSNHSPLEDDQP